MTKKSSKFGRRLEIPAGAIYALLAAVSLICVTVVAVAFADDGGSGNKIEKFQEDIKIPHLFIEDVFFRSYENEGITVEITIYITNDGTRDAYDVRAHIWPVVDDSNIATDMKEIPFNDIPVNQTRNEEMEIKLNAGTIHSVEILIFESSMLVLKGRAEVSTEGSGASTYTNVEVRGTSDDVDYDGMPDEWERFYGLDPNDPEDAGLDRDGDGIDNIMEYRLNRNPNVSPDDDDDEISLSDPFGTGDDNGAAFGAILFLVLIVGVIIALIIAAVVSSNKARKRAEQERLKKEQKKKKKDQPGKQLQFEHTMIEGAQEEQEEEEYNPFMDNHSP